MPTENDPIVDNWYFHKDKGQRFNVVAIDDKNETVEIQHFDGDVEEISFTDWYDMDIELSAEPENWSGPVDVGTVDDYGTEVTDTKASDWNEGLQEIRSPEDERD